MSDSDRAGFSLAFKRIQPLCASLCQKCCPEDLIQFEQALYDLDSEFIDKCHEYLFFPIRISLLRNQNENQLIKLLDIATFIFKKSHLESCQLFEDTVTHLFSRISDLDNIDMVSSASEELKLSVCQCVSSMIESASEEVRRYIYGSSFNLPLAHAFHTLLLLLKNERSKSLRRAILRTIGLFCYSKEFIVSRNAKMEASASDSLANYLPGLSVGLSSVVCGDDKQGESVIRMALRILSEVIVITVNDCCTVATKKNNELNSNLCKNNPVRATKDTKWFEEVASRLHLLIQNTTILVTHSQWKVRQDYLSFAKSILLDCTRNLQSSVPVILSTVFALSVDSNENVSQQSQKLILMFSDKFQTMNSLTLCSLIEDEMYTSASKLIKSKLSGSDNEKLLILKSMQGCLQILGSSVDKILFSTSHLEKLMLSLLNLLKFETAVMMVEEISVNLDISSFDVLPKKRFCHFEKKDILDSICNICHCLGKSKYNRLVIDYLIEKLHTSDIFLMQSIFLIGCIVEGLSKDSPVVDENISLVNDIISELLAPAIFDAPLLQTDSRLVAYNDQSPGNMYNDNNIYQVCLVLEAVEKCAKTLGKTFRVYLSKVLFDIMEKAGSTNYIISQSGKICLYGIAHYCDYKPRVELVRDNADYLFNSIIMNYHHFLNKPEVSAVLQVVLQESDGEMLPMFKDCIQRLLSMLDYNQERALPIMTILRSVVLYVRKWFPSKMTQDSKLSPSTMQKKSKDLKSYFIEKNKKTKDFPVANEDLDESDSGTNNQEQDFVEENEEKVPLHATLVSKILNKCSNFQSSRNLQLRVLVLEVMELSILALSDFERELHPLIHQLWNYFVRRFTEENVVVIQAFKILLVIADECRDFVRARCVKDVIPKLIALLKNKFSSSLLKNYIKSYQWSNDCKLQLCVLSEIGHLLVKLEVTEECTAQLVEVCLPYLQISQPKIFREAAFKTLQALTEVDPDAIWFYFNDQYSEKLLLIPPHKSLRPVHFSNTTPIDPQFKIDC